MFALLFPGQGSQQTGMGKFLFDPLRLAGIGNWERSPEGEWALSKMLIQSFEPMTDRSLEDAVSDLQKARVLWPEGTSRVARPPTLPGMLAASSDHLGGITALSSYWADGAPVMLALRDRIPHRLLRSRSYKQICLHDVNNYV